MTRPRKFKDIMTIFLTTTFAIGLFIFTLGLAEAHWTAYLPAAQSFSNSQATPIPPYPQPLGEPCGAGELFPPSVICLHGTVSLIDEMGRATLLDGVPITVSYGGEAITGTTFVHPGQVTPTYGFDISSLEPAFLEPVTLTAVIRDMIVSRQVHIFPDFRTQNQRFDLQVMALGGLDEALIWGEVIDFAARGAVAGATVVAEYQGQQVTVTSTVQLSDSLPTYAFSQSDLANIYATAGNPITLTAMYHGDTDQQVVIVPDSSRQINFVTGWKCDGFNPLPGTGGNDGLPGTGGNDGLPDMACFWGYGLVDGMPKTDLSVEIEIDGTIHEGQTTLYPGEELPRYGIGILDAEEISGQIITVTGVYSGFTSSQVVPFALDSNLSQRVDIAVADAGTRQSDLSLQLSAPADMLPNRPFTYTLQVANQGELAVERADLTLTLPVSATYLGASVPPSSTAPLSWELGPLPANSSPLTLVVTATLAADVLPGTSAIATAQIASITSESFLSNNNRQVTTLVRDPYRSDVGISLSGPPLLVADSEAVYQLWVNNSGGLPATATLLTVELPPELSYQRANPAPTTQEPLRWQMGTLPEFSPISTISLTLMVDDGVSAGEQLTVSATITTTSPDSEVSNNMATSTIATSLADAETLILVAPNRFATRYGASPLLSRLYELAAHPLVGGVVLDVERDADVQAAYEAWDADPESSQKANAVGESIKALIDEYTIEYPNLQYLVIVGGDAIIPFYRVRDQSPTTLWHEREYSRQLERHDTARAALAGNLLLTDDFYADRSPNLPESYFWYDQHPLYLPDFAIGRLVETPAEMITLIDSFLANEGQLTLDQNTVGSFNPLTHDLGEVQCSSLQNDGMTAICTNNEYNFRQEALNQQRGASWSAFHSNHFSIGPLNSKDIQQREWSYEQMLLVSIGCHAGLNVADSNSNHSFDLPQAILGRGGSYIASTSYAYASRLDISYSEALSLELTKQLLARSSQSLGQALIRAKQAYYADHGWFSYLDEKVLLPMTLYGLPMLQVTTPESLQVREAIVPPAALTVSSSEIDTLTVVTYTLSDANYTRHEIEEGVYYDFETQVIEQEGYPVQPTLLVPLTGEPSPPTPLPQGEGSFHGVILRSATYTEESTFDPVIAQSWATGAKHLLQAEPPAANETWDRPIPYSLALFDGLFETEASLSLVLGAYDSEHQVERLYENLTLEVLYSESLSRTAPVIHTMTEYQVNGVTYFQVIVSAESEVREVIAVCDDGAGNWRTASLNVGQNQQWEGTCQSAERFYMQAVDEAGNVAVSEWQSPSDAPTGSVLLALSPSTVTVGIGQTFDLPIIVDADTLPIDGASAYLNFEPAYLQVASISPGNALPTVLQESFDNASGQINFAAGTFDTFPTGNFTLATVTFTATTEIDGSQIDFNRTLPRQSDVNFAGISVLSDTIGSTITVENATLNGCVTLQGRPEPPHASLRVPLRVNLTVTGESTPAYQFTPTTDENGCFTLNGIVPNSYEVRVKKSTTLQTMQVETLIAGSNTIDFGLLREGDVNDNNYITIIDFSILRGSFGKCEGQIDYDKRADFNGDNCVMILDFSLLASNFGAGGTHQPARNHTSQPLNDVALVIEPQTSPTNINPGDLITLSVQLQAGTQPVDGAQLMLTFDPTVLEVLQLSPKSALPLELEKQFDNRTGTLSFVAGTLSNFPTGTFDILELQFRALTPPPLIPPNLGGEGGGTALTFQFSQTTDGTPTGTDVIFAGHSVLSAHSNAIVTINNEPSAITLQSFQHTSPSLLWLLLIPLMLTLIVPALALQAQKSNSRGIC